MKQIILDETENKILNCLKVGKSNAVRRETIVQLTNTHDRKVRSCIASMRRKGVAIISSSSCAGYWLAENDDEKKEYLKMMESIVSVLVLRCAKSLRIQGKCPLRSYYD